MKNIVFFSRRFGIGGAESFLINVFEKINKNKYNISLVLATSPHTEDLYEEKAKQLGIKIIHTNELDSLPDYLKYIKAVYYLLKNGNYDIVHSNTGSFDGVILLLAKITGINKRICHAHTLQSQIDITSKFKKILRNMYFKAMKKLMSNFSTDRIACSEQARNYFYGKSSGTVIYNGINSEKFAAIDSSKKEELIKKHISSLPSRKYRIISVGRISFEKNVMFAIRTINELKKIRDDFSYIWVGDGDMTEEAKSFVNQLNLNDTVYFIGSRTDVPQLLACCDVFIIPSLFEGLPFSLIEAQFSGLKCLASNGVPIQSNIGRTEFLSLDEGEEVWAKSINTLLEKKCSPLIEEKAKLFNIDYTIKQLESIYDK